MRVTRQSAAEAAPTKWLMRCNIFFAERGVPDNLAPMPCYRRAHIPGGTFFFTLVTECRVPLFQDEAIRQLLSSAIAECGRRHPFVLDAIVLLPDHLHLLMTLPPEVADFSIRIASMKAIFTRKFRAAGGREQARTTSRIRKRRRGVWQRWFWEHAIRDDEDLNHHLDYIHYNPVKHGLVKCPHAWPHSTFNRHVAQGAYSSDWLCCCQHPIRPPDFRRLALDRME